MATVVVPDSQLSLAIGKEGQNARLGAKITGWKIDISSETQYAEKSLSSIGLSDNSTGDEEGVKELAIDFSKVNNQAEDALNDSNDDPDGNNRPKEDSQKND